MSNESTQLPTSMPIKAPIKTLPQAVADRIAAGEVVERPAAVVKELVENALDAEASHIKVIIEDAGRTLIKVVDDGAGMMPEELKIAVKRHATSKLTRIEDLESLQTFGFRGEALPSIAAVSRFEIVSRPRGSDVGAVIRCSGGVFEEPQAMATPPGTIVSVGHLYYNVPARRKFLRSDATEFKWIATVFRYFALAFPRVHWELFKNGDVVLNLPPAEPRQRIAALFGDDIAEDMIEIDHKRENLELKGFITPPSLTLRSNQDQFLFLNRRPIASPRLNRAVYAACEPYYTSGGHPLYVIFLNSPPDTFDINVHPAKKEVKFADEGGTYSGLWAAVRNAITKNRQPEELTPRSSPSGRASGAGSSSELKTVIQRADVSAPSHLTPYFAVPRKHNAPSGGALPFKFDGEPDTSPRDAESETEPLPAKGTSADAADDTVPTIWQIFDTFILSPLKTGLVIIDQHIAHERILFEQALEAMEKMPWPSQQLLFSPIVAFSADDMLIIEAILPLLKAIGFELERFGPKEYRVTSVPTGIRISDEKGMLEGIIADYRINDLSHSDPRHRLAAAFACKGAIKAGQPLKPVEMQRLIEELFLTEDPEFCPHGRPIYHVISRREMEKWFKR